MQGLANDKVQIYTCDPFPLSSCFFLPFLSLPFPSFFHCHCKDMKAMRVRIWTHFTNQAINNIKNTKRVIKSIYFSQILCTWYATITKWWNLEILLNIVITIFQAYWELHSNGSQVSLWNWMRVWISGELTQMGFWKQDGIAVFASKSKFTQKQNFFAPANGRLG